MIENQSILIVEATEFQRTMLARLLESFGGAPRIISLAGPPSYKGDFEIVFIDASLADNIDRFRPASVIVTGSEKSDAVVADRIASGADTFLGKPFTREGLELALRELAFSKTGDGPSAIESVS